MPGETPREQTSMSLNTLRSKLDQLGVHPSRKLGQNFLVDDNIAAWIIQQLDLQPGENALEIGPGAGALSEPLVDQAAQTWLVEMDKRLAKLLTETFADDDTVTVLNEDAVQHDFRNLHAEQPIKIIGNLPYSCGGHIIIHYLMPPNPFTRAVFMLQKEVAERIVAVPRTKDYGAFSLRLQAYWRPKMLKSIGPKAFFPRPKVDSSIIVLERRAPDELPIFDHACFDRMIRLGFSQRRKQLKKLLGTAGFDYEQAANRLGLSLTARAEELSLENWIALANLADDHPLKDIPQKDNELFDVVDKNDAVLRQATRKQVHAENLLHRAIHIFVFNKSGELFLQKRSHLKDAHPSAWDSSAAGHLDAGEDYYTAAVRELEEELGIMANAPEFVAKLPASEATGWEHVRLYKAKGSKNLRYPRSEIETGAYFPLSLIQGWIERRPQDFASGFIECFNVYHQA